MEPRLVGVERADARKVKVLVAAERQPGGHPCDAPAVVEEPEPNRHASCERKMVKARLPVIGTLARALGREREPHPRAAAELCDELIDEAGALAPVHGDPAQALQQAYEGPAEERVLAHPLRGQASGE